MRFTLLAVFMLISLVVWSADGDTFTAQTIEGVEVTYEIVNEINGTCQVGFTYNAERGIKTAIDKSTSGTITIPDVVNGFIVSSVSDYAFNKCNQLTSVSLPKSIISIGKYAFAGCNGILSLILPNSVKSLGNGCFELCYNLQTLNIPDSVETIGKFCFNHCSSWASIIIPNSVKSIGNQAFDYCSKADTIISLIEVPFSITNWVFHSSPNHKLLIVPYGTKQLYQNYSGWKDYFESIEEASQTFKFIIESEGNGYVTYGSTTIKNQTKSFNLEVGTSATFFFTPETGYRISGVKVNDSDVTSSVKNNQYTISNISANTTLKVTFEAIPPSTYTLSISASGNGSASYSSTAVKNQTKSFTVEEGTSATISFTPDTGYRLASVKVNDTDVTSSVTNNQYTISSISANTTLAVTFELISFEVDGIVYYPIINNTSNQVKVIGKNSNYSGAIVIPEKVTYNNTTYDVKSIGDDAFNDNTDIASIVIPKSISLIGESAFYGCNNLASVYISSIESWCGIEFDNSSANPLRFATHLFVNGEEVNDIVIPEGVEIINDFAFYGFKGLKSIVLPSTLQWLDRAFGGCSNLKLVRSKAIKPASVEDKAWRPFNGIAENAILVVPKGAKEEYLAVPAWSSNFNKIVEDSYNLTITVSANGSVSYGGKTVRNNTQIFTVEYGASLKMVFTPDTGYRLASVKVNDTDVTSSVTNNQYTISSISANTTLAVTFEAIPPTTYTLSITSSDNGYASYSGTAVRGKTTSFTITEGSSATITFNPDDGYRIASVKVDDTDITASVSNNQYTISNISANKTLTVTFEAIPPTTYTLSITASGNGYASYNGAAIRGKSASYSINEGTAATITFTPDDGNRIASVKVNNVDVTASINNNKYTINSVSSNTTIDVVFEVIPPTTYTLSITATGNGSVTYESTTLKNQTQTFTLNEGSYATVALSPESGYRIKRVMLNNVNVSSGVNNGQYTISSITANTTLIVEFEAIPIPTYLLTITAVGNGSAVFDNTTIKDQSQQFTVNEGVTVVVAFNPDNGNSVKSVKVNGTDVTSTISGNRYVIEKMTANATIEVTFEEDVNALTVEGVNYTVVSQSSKTIRVTGGNYGQVLTVPASVTQNGTTWTVAEIDNNALKDNTELAAIIWNPSVTFTATVSNPNLLLYVTSEQYAPSSIRNVVVNGIASSITLVDAASGNSFYCPQAFTAQTISYTHNYSMTTGVGESRGWETIALPFDVQSIKHEDKGEIIPFAKKAAGDGSKPFWLYELTGSGFVEASEIKAYTPYVISMPNHPQYDSQWRLKGSVTFSASSVTIGKTEDIHTASFQGRTFVPSFTDRSANEGHYALNVNNDYATNNSGMTEGSKFVLNKRQIHPFEAYMTSTNTSRSAFGVFEGMTTVIREIESIDNEGNDKIYDLQGRKITVQKKGVYIKNGQKYINK